jgi:sulfite exporter TauE/SafE
MSDPLPWWYLLAYGLGLGLVWTSAHCAGMCGPLMLGLGLHAPELAGSGSARRGMGIVGRLGCYQLGRVLVYGAVGFVAGLLGAGAVGVVQAGASVLGIVLGVGFLIAAALHLRRPVAVSGEGRPPFAARFGGWVARHAPRQPLMRAFVLGLGLSALPCGIVFWALGLAVATADPWGGAALMATLVALTTPALAGVAFSPLALAAAPMRWRASLAGWAGRWLAPSALALSGVVVLGTTIARHYGAACPHCG